jgi:glycine betaine/proline transport system permease protein
MSQTNPAAEPSASPETPSGNEKSRRTIYILIAAAVFFIAIAVVAHNAIGPFPESWNLHLDDVIDEAQSWVIGNRNTHPIFLYFFDPISDFIDGLLRGVEGALIAAPWPAVILAIFFISFKLSGRKVAYLATVGLLLMGVFDLWDESMQTIALMAVSVVIALAFGIPIGILSARSDRLQAILRPFLDAMQTLPAFVYLIPVVLLFGIARVPSVVATVIYALPPAIRLTDMGIRQVPEEITEAADAYGSTEWQKLIKVQLPLAMPAILVGVNQTIMMALGIVVIAALIGAPGLGLVVYEALRRQHVGQALQAGIAIVLIAIVFDRISVGFSRESEANLRNLKPLSGEEMAARRRNNLVYWVGAAVTLGLVWVAHRTLVNMSDFPAMLQFSIAKPVDAGVRWMRDNLYQIGDLPIGTGPLSDFITIWLLNPLRSLLTVWLPWPVVIAGFALLAYLTSGWKLTLFTVVSLFFLGLMGLWEMSMDTLSQVLVAVFISVIIGIPLGIMAARSDRFESLLRPVLDFLQTIPTFVYLVPVIMLFNVGRVPGIMASVLYAIPPVIRLTNLGIRRVQTEIIEAAEAFGSTPRQMLIKVQLPLAMPSIMMGVNQTMMMVLAMVVIAGLVGGGALGLEAVTGLAKSQVGRGMQAGIAIVILAIILDRITQGWAQQQRTG